MTMTSNKHSFWSRLWTTGRAHFSYCKCDKLHECHCSARMLEFFMAKTFIVAGVIGFISILLTAAGLLSNPSPVVNTENGPVQGRQDYSRNGNKYFSYLSLPFAKPPVGSLRFEAPEPLRGPLWTDVRQATAYPPYCLQMDALVRGRTFGDEDCLYLNVFTYGTEKKRPVMIYIHGGGFLSGSSVMYRPDFLMDHEEIVLVTLNYRLGPLGFLNLGDGDDTITGNMGLKDQLLALKWVQKNIANFGGDPNHVTLFGESAGAASVQYHVISKASEGLFHRAIMQSGGVTCPWSFMKNPKDVARPYIESLHCPLNNSTSLLHCLKTMDPKKLVQFQINLMNPIKDFLMFVPSAEPKNATEPFLTENPRKLLKAGKIANKVPLIMGVTSGEGGLRTARLDAVPEAIEQIDKNWEEYALKVVAYDNSDGKAKGVAEKIRRFYFGGNSFTENLHDFKKNYTKMASDTFFYEPCRRAAKLHVKYGQPTYMYYYDYNSVLIPSTYSLFRSVRADDWIFAEAKLALSIVVDWTKKNVFGSEGPHEFGATHADDLFQLWNMEGLTGLIAGPDAEFSKNFCKSFVDFSLNTNPLMFNGVAWTPIQLIQDEETAQDSSSSELKYMLIGKTPKMINEPFADRMPFWESLGVRNPKK